MPETRSQTRRKHEEQIAAGDDATNSKSHGKTAKRHQTAKRQKQKARARQLKPKETERDPGRKASQHLGTETGEDIKKTDKEDSLPGAIVEICWSAQSVVVRSLVKLVNRHYPRLMVFITVLVALSYCYIRRDDLFEFAEKFGHARAICKLKQEPKHEYHNRTMEVDFLIGEFDRLRLENPNKEVHVIISGGPGFGKSELARQLGKEIHIRDNFFHIFGNALFDVSFASHPVDVVTLRADAMQYLQYAIEEALGICQGKTVDEITHDPTVEEENVLMKFRKLKKAFKNRSSKPVIIFDDVKEDMFVRLYKKRSHDRFLLNPGNDEYGELRIVVTSQYQPASTFRSISYKHLSDGLPLNDSVKLLNRITNFHNDSKNASFLAQELGGLPLSLANAGLCIQLERKFNVEASYYTYLKDFTLQLENYRHNVEKSWKFGVDEGLSYSVTAAIAAFKSIEQLVNTSSDHLLYQDVACFVGYCDSPTISAKLFFNYTLMNSALKDYTEFEVYSLIRKSSIYELKLSHKRTLILTHQVIREASRRVCNLRTNYTGDTPQGSFIEDSLARIVQVISNGLHAEPEPSLNQVAEYTTVNFKVVNVLLSLVSNSFTQNLNISKIITNEFCWTFLESMAEAYLYWPNKHKSCVIMPEVKFLVNLTVEHFSKQKPELAVLLSVLYLHNTGNQEPRDLERVANMVEEFGQNCFANVDKISFKKTTLLLNMIGTVYRGVSQKLSKAQQLHELALNISKRFDSPAEIAVSLHLLGIIHRYKKHLNTALDYHEEAVKLGRKIYSNRNPRLGAFLLNLAVVYNKLNERKRANVMYHEAINVTKDAYGSRDQRVARVLNTLATNYNSLGQYDASINVLLEALSIHQEIHGDYHPNVAETLYFMGFTYRVKGDLENSLQTLQRSLEIRQQYYGSQHYQVGEVLHDLSNTQRQLHHLDDALHNAKRCLAIFKTSLGANSSEFGATLNGLGLIYLDLGDANTAKAKHEEALEVFEALHEQGCQTVTISETIKNIGTVFKVLKNTKKAKEYYSRSLAMLQTVYENNHPRVDEINKLLQDLELL